MKKPLVLAILDLSLIIDQRKREKTEKEREKNTRSSKTYLLKRGTT